MFRTRESEKVRKEIFAWSFILLSTLILYSWTPVSGQMPEFQAPEPKFVGCQYRAQYAPIARGLGISFEEQPPGWITIYSKSDCDRLKAELRKTTVPTETPEAPLLPGVKKVNSVRGQVEIFRNGKVSPVRLDSEVGPGDIVRTGEDGIIGIVSKDGTTYLFGDTVVEFVGIQYDESRVNESRVIQPPKPSSWPPEFDPAAFELQLSELEREWTRLNNWEFWKGVSKDLVEFQFNIGNPLLACFGALATKNVALMRLCGTLTTKFVAKGLVMEEMRKPSLLVTDTSAILSVATEFTVNVAKDGATTVTVLNGSVTVMDLTSRNGVLLGANKQLTIPKTLGGLSQQDMLQRVATIDVKTLERWWEPTSTPSALPTKIPTVNAGIVVLLFVIIACVSIMCKRKRKKSQE